MADLHPSFVAFCSFHLHPRSTWRAFRLLQAAVSRASCAIYMYDETLDQSASSRSRPSESIPHSPSLLSLSAWEPALASPTWVSLRNCKSPFDDSFHIKDSHLWHIFQRSESPAREGLQVAHSHSFLPLTPALKKKKAYRLPGC